MSDDKHVTTFPTSQELPIGAAEMLQADVPFARWLTVIAAIMAAAAMPLMLLGGKFLNVGLIIAILTVLPAILAAASWSRLRSLRRRIAALRREHLVHWTYESDEWQSFDENWTRGLPVGEAYVGPKTAYCNRTFFEWNVFGATLLEVGWIDESHAELAFVIFYANPKSSGSKLLYRVPVPRGRREEADQLIETLQKNKQIVVPPFWGRLLLIFALMAIAAAALFILARTFGFIK